MATVIVTGASGFIGSHVVQQILEKTDWRIITIGSFRHNGKTPNLVEVATPYLDRVEAWVHDLRAPFSRDQREDARFAKAIINVASRCSVAESIQNPEPFILNNIQSVLTMLELARWTRPQHFIHVSTDEVFGPGEPYDLNVHLPSSPYSASKAAQEDLIHAYSYTYQIPATILNCSNMFGERQSGLAYVPRVIGACLMQTPVEVHSVNGAYGSRSYLYAANMASSIIEALQGTNFRGFWRLMCHGQQVVDNREMVEIVASVAGVDVPPIMDVEASTIRPGHDIHYSLKTDEYDITFDDALKRTIEWYRKKLRL